MANPEHLKILKQGVEAWNKWRKENPDIEPDLSGANLSRLDLRGVDFAHVSITEACLAEANLRGVDFYDADLKKADLRKAKLYKVNLKWANLRKANLSDARLQRATLTRSILAGANLSRSNLKGANLKNACLENALLVNASLREANLAGADLTRADLKGAKLLYADFRWSILEQANLENANLRYCCLVAANLSGADLTGSKLYGTSRDNWKIRGLKCKYVYWERNMHQRSPKDRDLEPGEFERLYAALPTIEYVFEQGMTPIDPLIMDRVVQAIRETRPEFDIKIDSINAHGPVPSIKFTVQHEEHKEPALEEVQKEYEERIERLEDEKDRLYELLGQAIDKAGDVKLITAGPGSIVATDGSTINIEQHVHNAIELQKAIAEEPEESESFAKVAKKTALDIIGGAIKDIAKGQVKEAAKQIIELGKDLGPIIAKMAAYSFFSNIGG